MRAQSEERRVTILSPFRHCMPRCTCAMIDKTKWLDPMKTSSVRAATVTVMVGPSCGFCFSPSEVTINPGDTVRWTWSSSGHSTTSGSPGSPNGIWDSGILNQGAMFTHTFNSVGSFPYYCTPHGSHGMVGTVTVASASPTPTATPPPSPTPGAVLGNISTRSFVQTGDNVMIGGFIVQGSGRKRVIIRAIGPELGQFGVPDPLQDPTFHLVHPEYLTWCCDHSNSRSTARCRLG